MDSQMGVLHSRFKKYFIHFPMLLKLKEFYLQNIVPELLTRKLEHSVDKTAKPAQDVKEKTLYCYCQTEVHGLSRK